MVYQNMFVMLVQYHKYFGKPSKDLTIAEAAYLAGIPQSPTYYSPYGRHTDALKERQEFILRRMKTVGYLTNEEYETQKNIPVVPIGKGETKGIKAPHFVFFIKNYLEVKYIYIKTPQMNSGRSRCQPKKVVKNY